jgi:hypothetical protein
MVPSHRRIWCLPMVNDDAHIWPIIVSSYGQIVKNGAHFWASDGSLLLNVVTTYGKGWCPTVANYSAHFWSMMVPPFSQ